MPRIKNFISVIGLGYVGLPLAIELGKKYSVIGFDQKKERINQLKKKIDVTREVKKTSFIKSKFLKFTSDYKHLADSKIFIISVPTPLKGNNIPDLSYIYSACDYIFPSIKKGCIIVLESTVYPGFCDELLAPYIEQKTGFKLNKDFFLGYSPERINPGDTKYKLENIKKIVSASNKKTLEILSKIYKKIIKAGIFKVQTIKVAESAKVIENIQRDINVAFVNELSMIFNKMNIDTKEVLKAAGTKWNFLKFTPGLVGGHCIGIDPYYLTYKCGQINFNPNLILAGRKINDRMPKYISEFIFNKFNTKSNTRGLILGATFKENCTDIRNSGSNKIYNFLSKKYSIDIYDPIANQNECKKIYNKSFKSRLKKNKYDFIIIAVAHNFFKKMGIKKIKILAKKKSFIVDVKGIFKKSESDIRL